MTTISSKDNANASSPPAITALRIDGNVTYRNVCHPSAPRSIDASTNDVGVRRSRATTLLKTTTMQNVAWPMMIANRPNGIPEAFTDEFRAIAVTIPGSAIGSTSRNETELRPKNRKRWTANAAALPSTSAMRVTIVAICKEFPSASRTSGLRHAIPNHFVVQLSIGHACPMLLLNA